MMGKLMFKKLLITLTPAALIVCGFLTIASCDNSDANAAKADNSDSANIQTAKQDDGVIEPSDIIARVGDEVITFSELNTTLNSSAMVGLSIPALGTPERNRVIITLLDKAISANLIYLDAKQKGTDKETAYLSDLKKFEEAVLISMYRSKVLIGEIPVSEEEVNNFYKSNISPTNELTDDLKLAIESKIRQSKYNKLEGSLRERLRAGTSVKIDERVLGTEYDSKRSPADVVATVGDRKITWSDVEIPMRGADFRATLSEFYVDDDEERLHRLNDYIDYSLMVDKARAAGMDKEPEFVQRTAEYRKTRLINIHRAKLIKSWQPSDDELKTYFMDNIDHISVPESRKVQMVVVATKEEAEDIKKRIDDGEITIYQAAQQYSLDPNAKNTLGEMGWVKHGTGFPELDDFTFNLDVDVIGGPVKSPAGWHLVRVEDVQDAQYQNIDDPETHKLTLRRYMQEKFNNYVVDLRKNHFKVAVYEDELTRNFQKEADMIAELNKKAKEKDSITKQRQKDLDKWIGGPPSQQIGQ
jgi:parvulin-like peptidyl-prolyl isomerase